MPLVYKIIARRLIAISGRLPSFGENDSDETKRISDLSFSGDNSSSNSGEQWLTEQEYIARSELESTEDTEEEAEETEEAEEES